MNAVELENHYHQIWDKYEISSNDLIENDLFQTVLRRGFTFQCDDDIIAPDVLFIGINPAFKEGSQSEKNWYSQE